MRLRDLEPQFIRYETGIADEFLGQKQPDGSTQWGGFECEYLPHVSTLAEAQGIYFLCPKCYVPGKNESNGIGVHQVAVTFAGRGVLDHQGCHNSESRPTRWNVSGTGFDDLTVTPSILLQGGCGWHGWITNGEAT